MYKSDYINTSREPETNSHAVLAVTQTGSGTVRRKDPPDFVAGLTDKGTPGEVKIGQKRQGRKWEGLDRREKGKGI